MAYAKQQTELLAWQAAKERRWTDHRAAQAGTRHDQHKAKTGIVVELRVKQRSLQRLRRRRIQERKAAGL